MIKKLDDLEALMKQIKLYMMEEVVLEDDSTLSRLNYYISLKNEAKGDELLELVDNDDTHFIYGSRSREFKIINNWIDIRGGDDVEYDENFNTVAKIYVLSVASLIKDDLTDDVWFQSIRMGEVLKDVMVEFFRENSYAGFTYGHPSGGSFPERVSLKGSKSLKSEVSYTAIIQ